LQEVGIAQQQKVGKQHSGKNRKKQSGTFGSSV